MSTSGVGSTSSSTPSASDIASADGFSTLSSGDFIKIMMTQLENQDPSQPTDSNTILQQLSSLRSIEADMTLTDKLTSLVTQDQFATAGGLIGGTISGISDQNDRVSGVVSSVTKTDAGAILNLTDGTKVPFNNVDQVSFGSTGNTGNTNP